MRKLSLTLAGGFCGAIIRYALGAPLLALTAALPGARAGFPYDTLLINWSGALALGVLLGLFEHGAPVPSSARLALGSGLLGAYTTFGALVVGADLMMRRGQAAAGAVYLVVSIAGGVALAFAGFWLAGACWARWRRGAVGRASWRGSSGTGDNDWNMASEREPVFAGHVEEPRTI